MFIKKTMLAVSLTILCSAFIESASAQKTEFTVEAGVIPPEFNQNNDTLLIFSLNPFYAGSMRKHFRKGGYTGEYETVTNLKKYSVDRCRYILYEITSRTSITNIGGPRDGMSRDMVRTAGFYIKDRKTGQNYVTDILPSPKNIHKYVAALEEARKK